jgi:hypothetical protein
MSPAAAGIPMARCKRRLATVWFVLSGLIFLLLVAQTVMGRYGNGATDAWGWFLPNVMPTLSLIVAVLVLDQMGKGAQARTADRFLFRLAISLSAAYLLLILLSILVQPFAPLPPLQLMQQANLWLGPLQGLVAGALGAFFIKAD